MTTFLRLLSESDKAAALAAVSARLRQGVAEPRCFDVPPTAFDSVPGKPFAYWVSEAVRQTFNRLPLFHDRGREAQRALSTNDDFRFLRAWWERERSFANERPASGWFPFAKGGEFSRFYADIYLLVNWVDEGRQLEADALRKFPYLNGNADWVLHRECNYLLPGLTWTLRTTRSISLRLMPRGCLFGHKGPAAFVPGNACVDLLALAAITNSKPFGLLVELQIAAADAAARSYEIGVIQKTPVADLNAEQQTSLATLARRAWSLKRTLDTIEEASHAFVLPAALRTRLGDYDPPAIESELACIQAEIDAIAFDLYGFSEADRTAVTQPLAVDGANSGQDETEDEDEDSEVPADTKSALLSWAIGVAFGRFDWRLATGERQVPPEPDPIDPLPAKSHGMLPDCADCFHAHAGILVDDLGHPHDLGHLIEDVLARVDVNTPEDVRRWLQRDFFAFHLQRYSKSRRKAPIYWPLSTASGSYTLWIYYPSLSSQTLYTAINDFIEPKLKQVGNDVTALRNKGAARTRDDERQFEALQSFELELSELRDTLLTCAPTYKPNHDDGVQITAAPLWPLFRHKPWHKLLKDTWTKLEKGDYEWAHLAMNYWPDRVREKCKTDKSLAIAHDLEDLYVEPEAKPKKTRGRKKAGGEE